MSSKSHNSTDAEDKHPPIHCEPTLRVEEALSVTAIIDEEDYRGKAEVDIETWESRFSEPTFFIHAEGETPTGDEFRYGMQLNPIQARRLRDRLDKSLQEWNI